jgi:hypothetical protein
MIYTPAKIKFFKKTHKTMVSTKPAMTVPQIESNGFFMVNLLVKILSLSTGLEVSAKLWINQESLMPNSPMLKPFSTIPSQKFA